MPRNMSFSMTTAQISNRTKDVTRRLGWWFLKPGDIVNAVEQAMGLRKGEKMQRICQLRIVSTRAEQLKAIQQPDVIREGFDEMTKEEFVDLFSRLNNCGPSQMVNRIEFEFI